MKKYIIFVILLMLFNGLMIGLFKTIEWKFGAFLVAFICGNLNAYAHLYYDEFIKDKK